MGKNMMMMMTTTRFQFTIRHVPYDCHYLTTRYNHVAQSPGLENGSEKKPKKPQKIAFLQITINEVIKISIYSTHYTHIFNHFKI